MIEIKLMTESEIAFHEVADLYQEVWGESEKEFLDRLRRHSTYPGFSGLVAHHDQSIVGFAYGYTSHKGQYYHDLLRKELTVSRQEDWLGDCFEFVELAVHPRGRRNNLGRRLVTNLLERAPHKTTILTTQQDNIPARRLYEKLHWEVIQENFLPGVDSESYVIMGKYLNN